MGIKPLSNLDRISTRTAEFVLWGYIWIRPRLDFCCRRSIGLCDRFLSLVISNLWFCLWKDLWEKERDRKGRKEMLLHHWPISIPLPNAFIHWNPDLCCTAAQGPRSHMHGNIRTFWELEARGQGTFDSIESGMAILSQAFSRYACNWPLQVSFCSLPRRRLPQFDSASGHSQILFGDDDFSDVHKIYIFPFPLFDLVPKSAFCESCPLLCLLSGCRMCKPGP